MKKLLIIIIAFVFIVAPLVCGAGDNQGTEWRAKSGEWFVHPKESPNPGDVLVVDKEKETSKWVPIEETEKYKTLQTQVNKLQSQLEQLQQNYIMTENLYKIAVADAEQLREQVRKLAIKREMDKQQAMVERERETKMGTARD